MDLELIKGVKRNLSRIIQDLFIIHQVRLPIFPSTWLIVKLVSLFIIFDL